MAIQSEHLAPGALSAVAVVVLAKFPSPGKVKTRLTPALSPETAAAVHRRFLLHGVQRLGRLGPAELIVCFDPPDAREAMQTLLAGPGPIRLIPQASGDLGYRLAGIASSVGQKHDRTLILAVDSPDVPQQHIEACAKATADAQVVLGLAEDGGYWCIGVRNDVDAPALLHSGIDWSTEHAAAQTLANARQLGCSTWADQQWDDVDQPADLIRLLARLSASQSEDDRLLYADLVELLPTSFAASTGTIAAKEYIEPTI